MICYYCSAHYTTPSTLHYNRLPGVNFLPISVAPTCAALSNSENSTYNDLYIIKGQCCRAFRRPLLVFVLATDKGQTQNSSVHIMTASLPLTSSQLTMLSQEWTAINRHHLSALPTLTHSSPSFFSQFYYNLCEYSSAWWWLINFRLWTISKALLSSQGNWHSKYHTVAVSVPDNRMNSWWQHLKNEPLCAKTDTQSTVP